MRSLAGEKPLDIGTGVVCASFAADGSWLSFGGPHPHHGFVELSAMPPFDEAERGVPALVRRYRASMTDPAHSFLSFAPGTSAEPAVRTGARSYAAAIRHDQQHRAWALTAVTRARPGERSLQQALTLRGDKRRPTELRLRFRGRLDRPALAEITEVSPPAPTGARTVLSSNGALLSVVSPELPAEVRISVSSSSGTAAWRIADARAELSVPWPPTEDELTLTVRVDMSAGPVDGPPRAAAHDNRPPTPSPIAARPAPAPRVPWLVVPTHLAGALRHIRRRALAYIRGCTCLRVADSRAAILTDHRILPLSWTRDAYYQSGLLLGAAAQDGDPALVSAVEDHLRWLWLSCQRPDVTWARSHHADGRRKDDAYQADQQLYPLLELADFWRVTGRLPGLATADAATGGWSTLVSAVLDRLAAGLSPDGLLATDENAADDAARGQLLLANQVLAWHTFRRLAEMSVVLPLPVPAGELAAGIRRTVLDRYRVVGPAGPIWAYAIHADGRPELYHDANDLPTALAPRWGFCDADDAVWRATMRFAFSPANDGYVPGPMGGLGSRHTPGTWTLGLAQEWVACSLMGDTAGAERAVERLVRLRFPDASLPEAADPDSGRALARHWFAWPGALVGALLDGSI